MKTIFIIAFFIFALASAKSNDSDTVWTKDLWPENISQVKFTTDGARIIVSASNSIYVLDTYSNKVIHKFSGLRDDNKFVISEDNRYLYTLDFMKFDLETYKTIDTLIYIGIFPFYATDIEITKDNQKLLITSGTDGPNGPEDNIVIIDANAMETAGFLTYDGYLTRITMSSDGSYFATASHDGNVKNEIVLWDAQNLKQIKILDSYENQQISEIIFSPDSKMLAVCVDNNCIIYDLNQNNDKVISNGILMTSSIFSKQSQQIFLAETSQQKGFARIVDIDDMTDNYIYNFLNELKDAARCLDVSNDNQNIAFGGYSTIYLVNARWEPSYISESNSPTILDIYPNPVTDYIEIMDMGDVKIYDVLGMEHPATAWHPSLEGNVRIDVSALPKGVYFVSVGGRMYKFVKW